MSDTTDRPDVMRTAEAMSDSGDQAGDDTDLNERAVDAAVVAINGCWNDGDPYAASLPTVGDFAVAAVEAATPILAATHAAEVTALRAELERMRTAWRGLHEMAKSRNQDKAPDELHLAYEAEMIRLRIEADHARAAEAAVLAAAARTGMTYAHRLGCMDGPDEICRDNDCEAWRTLLSGATADRDGTWEWGMLRAQVAEMTQQRNTAKAEADTWWKRSEHQVDVITGLRAVLEQAQIAATDSQQAAADHEEHARSARADLDRLDPTKVAAWITERGELAGQVAELERELDAATQASPWEWGVDYGRFVVGPYPDEGAARGHARNLGKPGNRPLVMRRPVQGPWQPAPAATRDSSGQGGVGA